MVILKDKQRKALWEIVAMGQNNGLVPPTRKMRKAARAAWRVLDEQGATPNAQN